MKRGLLLSLLLLSSCGLLLVGCGKKPSSSTSQNQNEAETAEQRGDESASAGQSKAAPREGAEGPADESNPLFNAVSDTEKQKFEAWFTKNKIDPNDTAALEQDLDGDGYSNREEFLADTNPRNVDSAPGILVGVKLKSFQEAKVPVILREVKDGTARIQYTDTSTGSAPAAAATEEIRAGSTLKNLPYKVLSVKHQMATDKHGVETDMSQAVLEDPKSKDRVTLVRDMPARSPQTHATIETEDGQTLAVRHDEKFMLNRYPGKTFQVLDLRPDQVVIQEIGTNKTLTIPKVAR